MKFVEELSISEFVSYMNVVGSRKVKAFVKQAEILEILKEIRQSKKNYLLFSKYMEALIAFHKYYGGKEQ